MDALPLHFVTLILLAVFGGGFQNSKSLGNSILKIMGGVETVAGDYPPIVYLTINEGNNLIYKINNLHCGASIVNKFFILTAAHCCIQKNPARYTAIAGVHNVNEPDENWQWRSISKYQIHPQFNLFTMAYDLCVMRLEEPFNLNGERVAAGKFTKVDPSPGSGFTIFGWGRHNFDDVTNSPILYKVNVTSVSFEDCNERNGGKIDPGSMLCATVPHKGPCQGDSGGPIVWHQPGQGLVQVGIVSWGNKCGLPNYPAVFTNIPKIYDWLLNATIF